MDASQMIVSTLFLTLPALRTNTTMVMDVGGIRKEVKESMDLQRKSRLHVLLIRRSFALDLRDVRQWNA